MTTRDAAAGAAERHVPVMLEPVLDLLGPRLQELSSAAGEDRLLHELGVERGDAVDRMRADEGEMRHAHAPSMALVDERQRGEVGLRPPGAVQNLILPVRMSLNITQSPAKE